MLVQQNDELKLSKNFDRKAIMEPMKEAFSTINYEIDEGFNKLQADRRPALYPGAGC